MLPVPLHILASKEAWSRKKKTVEQILWVIFELPAHTMDYNILGEFILLSRDWCFLDPWFHVQIMTTKILVRHCLKHLAIWGYFVKNSCNNAVHFHRFYDSCFPYIQRHIQVSHYSGVCLSFDSVYKSCVFPPK